MGNRTGAPELLAPAGSLDAFKAALAAGADAVYCGTGRFNARRNAENLSLEQLACACRMAHLAGARVYVAANILVRSEELPEALRLVRDCALAGADAFIVQDWGLLSLARQLWPGLEMHLSTQANVHDPWGVRFAAGQGCSRVTLSRELSLPEIRACSGQGAEVEVFGHGAICVCYSGECLLSSAQRGRSANRGLCRQPCRLPYRMLDDVGRDLSHAPGTRLLSPKDMCVLGDLGALAEAGCASVKVEGRMKAPDYVATVVGVYRRALDRLAEGTPQAAEEGEEDMRALSRAFNRGFTDAYLRGESGNEMMSFERGNNRGQLAGRLARADGAVCEIELCGPVGAGDLLEVRNPARFDDYVTVPAPRDAPAGATVRARLPRPMPEGCPVRVIRSEAAMERARQLASRAWPRKRPVRVRVRALLGLPLRVELRAQGPGGDVAAAAEGGTVGPARTRPLREEDLREHVGRFGSSPFEPASWDIELDPGAGASFSEVHAVRAKAAERLEEALLKPWAARAAGLAEAPFSVEPRPAPRGAGRERPRVCALVCCPAAARAALEAGADEVMAPADDLVLGPGSSGRADLAQGPQGPWPEGVSPLFPEVSRLSDIERLGPLLSEGAEAAVGTVGWLSLALERGARPWLWQTVPLHNHAALDALAQAGAAGAWLSPELTLMEVGELASSSPVPLGIVVSGHQRTMTCEHCALQAMGPCSRACPSCSRRRGRVTLRDEFDRPSLVTSDALGRSRLWEATPLDATPQVPELLSQGVTRLMADCAMLDAAGTAASVRRARRALDAALSGRPAASRAQGAGSGHLFERIG